MKIGFFRSGIDTTASAPKFYQDGVFRPNGKRRLLAIHVRFRQLEKGWHYFLSGM
jgi:hypothetical protein